MFDREAIAAQVVKLRTHIERDGGATVGCDELDVLCPDVFSKNEQYLHVAMIARKEGWSFAFLPDGSVHFGAYAEA